MEINRRLIFNLYVGNPYKKWKLGPRSTLIGEADMNALLQLTAREKEGLPETPGAEAGKDTLSPVLSENAWPQGHSDLPLGPRKKSFLLC